MELDSGIEIEAIDEVEQVENIQSVSVFSARAGSVSNTHFEVRFPYGVPTYAYSTTGAGGVGVVPISTLSYPFSSNPAYLNVVFNGSLAVVGSTYADIVFLDLLDTYVDTLSISGTITTYITSGNSATVPSTSKYYCLSCQLVGVRNGEDFILSNIPVSGVSQSISIPSRTISVYGSYDYIAIRCYYDSVGFKVGGAYPFYYLSFGSYSFSGQVGNSIRDLLQLILDALGSNSSPNYTAILNLIRGDIQAMQSAVTSGLTAVGNAVQSVKDTLTSSSQQDSVSNEYKEQMQDTLDKIDEANQTIEDNTNRPSADSIVPDVPDIIQDGQIGGGDAAATELMDGFGQVLASPLILQQLLLVFSLAFVSYVLFGKKE